MSILGVKLPEGITCPDWESKEKGKKLCRYYLRNEDGRGMCELPKNFSCIEWDKANPSKIPQAKNLPMSAEALKSSTPGTPGQLYLGGAPLGTRSEVDPPRQRAGRQTMGHNPGSVPVEPGADLLTSITTTQVAELEAAGLEFKLAADGVLSDVWLVPHRTEQDRTEVTFAEASTLRMIADVFPGARVTEIRKPKE